MGLNYFNLIAINTDKDLCVEFTLGPYRHSQVVFPIPHYSYVPPAMSLILPFGRGFNGAHIEK